MKPYLLRYSNLEPEFAQAMSILASLAVIFCGIAMFYSYFKNKNKITTYYPGNNLFVGVYFFLWGSATLPFAIKWNMHQYLILSALLVGVFLLISGVFQIVYLKNVQKKFLPNFLIWTAGLTVTKLLKLLFSAMLLTVKNIL